MSDFDSLQANWESLETIPNNFKKRLNLIPDIYGYANGKHFMLVANAQWADLHQYAMWINLSIKTQYSKHGTTILFKPELRLESNSEGCRDRECDLEHAGIDLKNLDMSRYDEYLELLRKTHGVKKINLGGIDEYLARLKIALSQVRDGGDNNEESFKLLLSYINLSKRLPKWKSRNPANQRYLIEHQNKINQLVDRIHAHNFNDENIEDWRSFHASLFFEISAMINALEYIKRGDFPPSQTANPKNYVSPVKQPEYRINYARQTITYYKTSTEVSEILERTPDAVKKMCQRAVFPGAEKKGKTWLIPANEIDLGRDLRPGAKSKNPS